MSKNTKAALRDVVQDIVIVQDRERDIYEQFAVIPEQGVDLVIRAKTDRTLKNKKKLFSCLSDQQVLDKYEVVVDGKKSRQKWTARIE